MKAVPFAKIFETEKGQLLITKGFDDEEEKPMFETSAELGGIRITLKFTFEENEARNGAFDDMTVEGALRLLNAMIKTLSDFSDEGEDEENG